MKTPAKKRSIKIAVTYTVRKNSTGCDTGHLLLTLPDRVGRRFQRWPGRYAVLDALHELCRSEYYDRPLHKRRSLT